MLFSPQALAMFLPGYVRVGGLYLTVYGLFAALGLLAALWLSQRTAARVGIAPDKLWDAGVFAVVAAFIASRLLLIAFDLHSFLRFPLLMLALPSLTYTCMFLTGLMVWAWLRWKRMPIRDVLDAWAPCAALLAGVLSIGHFFEGTDAGMPTRLPWGVITPGDSVLGHVHPVQIYAALVALMLCVGLFQRLPKRKFAGEVAALVVMVGGAAGFLLDMLRQPVESDGSALLDPGQWVALASVLAGFTLWKIQSYPEPTRLQIAELLEAFAAGTGRPWDHETFENQTFSDPLIANLQKRFGNVWKDYPDGFRYCSDEGLKVLLECAKQLRETPEMQRRPH